MAIIYCFQWGDEKCVHFVRAVHTEDLAVDGRIILKWVLGK
jgi:hypothetical protein